MRGEGGSQVTSKLKQGAPTHVTAWPVPQTCAQPYHVANGSRGQPFCPYWESSALHSRRSMNGETHVSKTLYCQGEGKALP